jgi:hypothetical protein
LPAIAVPVGTSDSEYVVVVVGALEPRVALPDLEAELGTELLCAEAKGERARSATREDKKKVIVVRLQFTRTQLGDGKHHSVRYMMYYILSLISSHRVESTCSDDI